MAEHKLINLITEIDSTHPRLGRAVAMSVIALKAQQFLLLIAPTGCGKSAVRYVIEQNSKDVISFLTITRAKLRDYAEQLTSFRGIVLMDDVTSGNLFERRDTVVSFSMLCHEHFTNKQTMVADYAITDFYGAALLNIQPVMLSNLYESPEWEGLLQDKTLRYYHLFRPAEPQEKFPNVKFEWGINIDEVQIGQIYDGKVYDNLLKIAQIQWSDSRALQHLHALLKATAAFDNRKTVIDTDYQLLFDLMRPMIVERYLFTKSGFEEGRKLDINLAAMMVEFASWPRVDIERITRDYKISPSAVYVLLHNLNGWLNLDTGHILPSENLSKILRELGVKK